MNPINLIILKGGNYNDIKKALKQWINLYSESLHKDITFQLFNQANGECVIIAHEKLDNQSFYFLVNYLKYPENIAYEIDVEGFTIGKDKNILKEKNLLVFISQNDTDYDNVFLTTSENKNYKIDFGGKISESQEHKKYFLANHFPIGEGQTFKVNIKKKDNKIQKQNEFKVEKRFNYLSIIALVFIVINHLIFIYEDIEFSKDSSSLLGMGLWLWFFSDYEMLRQSKLYNRSLIYAVIFAIYCNLAYMKYDEQIDSLFGFGAFTSLSVLLLQWPMRKIYIRLLKKEPKIDKHGKFSDLIYTFILFIGSILLPMIMKDYLI